jgi:hypothetical protein
MVDNHRQHLLLGAVVEVRDVTIDTISSGIVVSRCNYRLVLIIVVDVYASGF